MQTSERINNDKICYCCGKKIYNKHINSFYCKECAIVLKDIQTDIYSIIYRKKIRQKYDDFCFRLNLQVVKKNKKLY
jgi:hypothetical protein